MNTMYTGYTQPEYVKPANKQQLVALRDLLLGHGDKNAAAAVDNVIDILGQKAGEITQSQEPVSNHDLLVRSGVVNADGSLKPYIATGHKSQPLTSEDVTDFFEEEQ